ncbi:MAG: TonB-dependent receptor [Rhodospirillaceae bacterium]|jgi:iron complex outermembrane receptor protein|nr:TonB-dependent receptor [Rhodospirillaceae bacterium]
MFGTQPLKYALLSSAAVLLSGQTVQAQSAIPEIIVTATKRSENLQDVPIAVQALSAKSMQEQGIDTFDDYVRFLPNVTFAGRGPGQSTVFIRGMAVEQIGVQLSGTQGSTPNVALYLDEQPVTASGRNLDVYAADMERIEVLPGPQGTMFGASSQAGTVRLITNKPQLNEFQAGFDSSTEFTKSGDMSEAVEAYINVPIIEDKLAFRAAVYSVQLGGYIDNVEGTFSIDPSVNPLAQISSGMNATFVSASNGSITEKNFNDSFYKGMRLGLKWSVTPDWDVLVQHSRQELGADGVFDYDPEVGDLQVKRFFPDNLRDEFNQTSWTVEGRMAMLDVVYTGAYLNRDIEQSIDYTGYNNAGAYIAYYTCTYDAVRECFNPAKGFQGIQGQTRNTHEFRFNTPQENSLRITAGVFYDDFKIEAQDDFNYFSNFDRSLLGFPNPKAPLAPSNRSVNPNPRSGSIGFYNDVTRSEKQTAVFGEVTYDFTDQISAKVGARYYDLELDLFGSSNFTAGGGRDYDVSGGHTLEPLSSDDVILKGSVSYRTLNDNLLYVTYSEGYRPGGWNRGGGLASRNPAFPGVKSIYKTDDVKNYEFGWKTSFLNNSLRFNGSAYFIDWTDIQVKRFDPQNVSILTFIENSADAEIMGVEADVAWQATDNLTLFGAFSYNDTEVTAVNAQVIELTPAGSALPLTPEFQGTFRARYVLPVGDYDFYGQLAAQYADSSFSSLITAEREQQSSYFTSDLSVGASTENWNIELFVQNLTDKRAELNINVQDDIRRITTNRPRTVGLRVSYDY